MKIPIVAAVLDRASKALRAHDPRASVHMEVFLDNAETGAMTFVLWGQSPALARGRRAMEPIAGTASDPLDAEAGFNAGLREVLKRNAEIDARRQKGRGA